jgi:hypothetical protein
MGEGRRALECPWHISNSNYPDDEKVLLRLLQLEELLPAAFPFISNNTEEKPLFSKHDINIS